MIRALAIAAFALAGSAAYGQTCDRACLKTSLDQYLTALVKHEPSAVRYWSSEVFKHARSQVWP